MMSPLPAFLDQPLPDLHAWTRHFQTADIPILADTAAQLETLRACEDAVDAHLIAQMVAGDPLMTLKLLAHAAGLRSGRRTTDAETVTAAVVLMGIPPFFRAFGPQPTVEERLRDMPEALAGLHKVLRRAHRAARFALGMAVHRRDPDAAVVHEAALLHDFAEMLLWCHAPSLALRVSGLLAASPGLRSVQAQQQVLGMELSQLQQALMRHWHLPELLIELENDRMSNLPQVRTVTLAVRLARHSSQGWNDPALPDDFSEVSTLLRLTSAAAQHLVHELDPAATS